MAVTPNYSWPVPVNTDYVKDGAEAIKDLGDAIDATVFGLPAGGLTLISDTALTGSSVSINNCFSATYKTYRLVLDYVPSTNLAINFRYRTGGEDNSGGNYYWSSIYWLNNGANGIAGSGGGTTSSGALGAGVTTNPGSMFADIAYPFEEKQTKLSGHGVYAANGLLSYTNFNVGTSFDGLTIYTSTGTFTSGNLRIYGYQD